MDIRNIIKSIYYLLKYLQRVPIDIFRHNKINATNRIATGASVKYSRFGSYNYVAPQTGMYNVTMGNYCSIGPHIIFGGMEHSHWWISMSPILSNKADKVAETKIGNDVWIGANCVISAGVKIGDGAVVGAHSFVNKDVEPFSIVVGSPAKHIRYRFDKEIISKIMESHYWDLPPAEARIILNKINIDLS